MIIAVFNWFRPVSDISQGEKNKITVGDNVSVCDFLGKIVSYHSGLFFFVTIMKNYRVLLSVSCSIERYNCCSLNSTN